MSDALQAALIERAKREKARRAGNVDEMGFPVTPQGGVSTNSPAVAELGSKMDSAFMGAVEGAKFNLGDNIAGARSAILGMRPQPEGPNSIFDYTGGFGGRYAEGRDQVREQLQAAQEANPKSYGAGNIAGMFFTSLASAPIATGKTLLGTMGRGGAIGMGEGALIGGGSADGKDVGKGTVQGLSLIHI